MKFKEKQHSTKTQLCLLFYILLCIPQFFPQFTQDHLNHIENWNYFNKTTDFSFNNIIIGSFTIGFDSVQVNSNVYGYIIDISASNQELLIAFCDFQGITISSHIFTSTSKFHQSQISKTNVINEIFYATLNNDYSFYFGFMLSDSSPSRGSYLDQENNIDSDFSRFDTKSTNKYIYIIGAQYISNQDPNQLQLILIDIQTSLTSYSIEKSVLLQVNVSTDLKFTLQAYDDDKAIVIYENLQGFQQKIDIDPNTSLNTFFPINYGINIFGTGFNNFVQTKSLKFYYNGDTYYTIVISGSSKLSMNTFKYNFDSTLILKCNISQIDLYQEYEIQIFNMMYGVIDYNYVWIKGEIFQNSDLKTSIFFMNPLQCSLYKDNQNSLYMHIFENTNNINIIMTFKSLNIPQFVLLGSYFKFQGDGTIETYNAQLYFIEPITQCLVGCYECTDKLNCISCTTEYYKQTSSSICSIQKIKIKMLIKPNKSFLIKQAKCPQNCLNCQIKLLQCPECKEYINLQNTEHVKLLQTQCRCSSGYLTCIQKHSQEYCNKNHVSQTELISICIDQKGKQIKLNQI
ncbi:Insulin-like growth factor binding protein, N-terminal [Pseudocohnilembus persalinus]|uniref:Insulin-like growth factor binding protein, N-terminal n=1 Tax=Pseudocohnilembus persalinus TaxID=266149 RepID=A0A0V0Q802_PSEPJ|nr:Insulin-like growth factor binding protein, N-terminal [Pseudocohnilembus persalinus]|eukprot:KRW98376.1 Insulin-like growth factor binding protein, N-terminal [Pseudocohnilembus persalinus]